MNPDTLPEPVVEAAARAMEDEAIRLLGRDLGTIHRDAIASAALGAALPLLALDREQIEAAVVEAFDYDEGDGLTPFDLGVRVADVILAASPLRTVTDAQAEALREAADEWDGTEFAGVALVLRARAARLAGGDA